MLHPSRTGRTQQARSPRADLGGQMALASPRSRALPVSLVLEHGGAFSESSGHTGPVWEWPMETSHTCRQNRRSSSVSTSRGHAGSEVWALWSDRPEIEYWLHQFPAPTQGESQMHPRTNPHAFQKLLVSYRIKPHLWQFSSPNTLPCTSLYPNTLRLILVVLTAVQYSIV